MTWNKIINSKVWFTDEDCKPLDIEKRDYYLWPHSRESSLNNKNNYLMLIT